VKTTRPHEVGTPRNLWGASEVLRYLREEHQLTLTRRALHRLRVRSGDPIPVVGRRIGSATQVHAYTVDIDAWMRRVYGSPRDDDSGPV